MELVWNIVTHFILEIFHSVLNLASAIFHNKKCIPFKLPFHSNTCAVHQYTVMNKSLRPPCKSGDFQYLACDYVSHISLLHHEFIFFSVFHFESILASVHNFCFFFCYYLCYCFLVKKSERKSL